MLGHWCLDSWVVIEMEPGAFGLRGVRAAPGCSQAVGRAGPPQGGVGQLLQQAASLPVGSGPP